MEEIKRNRRSIKEITEEMLNVNKRKPSEKELNDLVKIINDNAIPENCELLLTVKLNRSV